MGKGSRILSLEDRVTLLEQRVVDLLSVAARNKPNFIVSEPTLEQVQIAWNEHHNHAPRPYSAPNAK